MLYLDLHYLLSYWDASAEGAEAEQKILTWTMQQLQSHPILDTSVLSLVSRSRMEQDGLYTFQEGESDVETIITTFYERCLDGRPEAVRVFIEEELVSPHSGARIQQDERAVLRVFADGCKIPGAADDRHALGYGNPSAARACLEDLVNQRRSLYPATLGSMKVPLSLRDVGCLVDFGSKVFTS